MTSQSELAKDNQAIADGGFSSVAELISDIAAGKMVILCDDEDRENEGDLVMAADKITPEAINFMVHKACGILCLALPPRKCQELGLSLMVQNTENTQQNSNSSMPQGKQPDKQIAKQKNFVTSFTLSIDARDGVTTGVSAKDRYKSIQTAINPDAVPQDLVMPGHVFPVMAHPDGLAARHGHTEASCALAKMAGLSEAGVMIEIMNEDGSMARLPELKKFAAQHDLRIGSIADIVKCMQEA